MKETWTLKKELPVNTSKRQIKRDFRIPSKIRWLSFAFKDKKPKGLFLEIAAPLKGGHAQTGTGRSLARQGPCQCQEHQSSFYALWWRCTKNSCNVLWALALTPAGCGYSSSPTFLHPSMCRPLSATTYQCFCWSEAGKTGAFEPHPTTSLNHNPSK